MRVAPGVAELRAEIASAEQALMQRMQRMCRPLSLHRISTEGGVYRKEAGVQGGRNVVYREQFFVRKIQILISPRKCKVIHTRF